MNHWNWDDLKYLLATAQAGTYSLAAKELGVNRTTVARRITALENQLGVPLFEQLPEGFQLTGTGQQVLDSAEQLEQEIDDLQGRLLSGEQALKGNIRVAAPLGLGPEFMPEIAQFTDQHPGIQLELINTIDPVASLNLRKAEVGIAVGHELPAYLTGEKIADLTRAIYATRRYFANHPTSLPLASHNWIGWGKEMSDTQVAKWMQHHLPSETRTSIQINSWHALRETVNAGVGVAHLWCFIADKDKNLLQLQPPTDDLTIGLWLFHHADVPASARVKAFIQTLLPLLRARIQ